jgi:hypothetical protein
MLKIEGDNFKIWYKKEDQIIYFEGSLRLWDPSEYSEIRKFMLNIHDLGMDSLTLDLSNLEFLNSSGISMLCKFVFEIKKSNRLSITLIGKNEIMWQQKSLHNIKKLWDRIELVFVN